MLSLLSELTAAKREYDRIAGALESVRQTGYGMVPPSLDEMVLAQPEIVRCKGCRFYALSPYTTHGIKICQKWGGVRMDDDFCSRGERKEDG